MFNEELNDPDYATNSAKLSEIHERMTQVQEDLERLYETWEALAEENSGC